MLKKSFFSIVALLNINIIADTTLGIERDDINEELRNICLYPTATAAQAQHKRDALEKYIAEIHKTRDNLCEAMRPKRIYYWDNCLQSSFPDTGECEQVNDYLMRFEFTGLELEGVAFFAGIKKVAVEAEIQKLKEGSVQNGEQSQASSEGEASAENNSSSASDSASSEK